MLLNAAAPASPTSPAPWHAGPALPCQPRDPRGQAAPQRGRFLTSQTCEPPGDSRAAGAAGPGPGPAAGAPGRERGALRTAGPGELCWRLCAAAAAGQPPDRTGTGTGTSPAPRSPPPLSPRTRPLLGRGSRGPRPPAGHGGLVGSLSRWTHGRFGPAGHTGGSVPSQAVTGLPTARACGAARTSSKAEGRDLGWRCPGTPPRCCCCCWVLAPWGVGAPTCSTEEMCKLTTIHHAPRVLGGGGWGHSRDPEDSCSSCCDIMERMEQGVQCEWFGTSRYSKGECIAVLKIHASLHVCTAKGTLCVSETGLLQGPVFWGRMTSQAGLRGRKANLRTPLGVLEQEDLGPSAACSSLLLDLVTFHSAVKVGKDQNPYQGTYDAVEYKE